MFCRFCGSSIPVEAEFCPQCGKILKKKEESSLKSPTIEQNLESDFKLYLDNEVETVFLRQYVPSKFYLNVKKLSSASISGVKVQLSGPPQVKLLLKSRSVGSTRKDNRFYFTISASEPGFFTINAILTSRAGHRIAFPIEIDVEPKKPIFNEEPPVKPAVYTPQSGDMDGWKLLKCIFYLTILIISAILFLALRF